MTCVDCHDPHDRKGQPVKLTMIAAAIRFISRSPA